MYTCVDKEKIMINIQRKFSNSGVIVANNSQQLVATVTTTCIKGSTSWVDWSIDQGVPKGASAGYPGWGYRVTYQPEGQLEFVLDTRGSSEQGRMYTVMDLASGNLAIDTPSRNADREWVWRLYWYGYTNENHSIILNNACLRVTTY